MVTRDRRQVVVVGGGFGGLQVVIRRALDGPASTAPDRQGT